MTLPDFSSVYELKLEQTSGQVITPEKKTGDSYNSSIVIRIPYKETGSGEKIPSGTENMSAEDIPVAGGMECSFCSNALTSKGNIRQHSLLPSGKFDHVSGCILTYLLLLCLSSQTGQYFCI